ncbi:uncharacterized protein [Coffea arabica]|uniref:Retrotransposon gag domain-containing protein n=1 Tax=Coffea arabica TaxID=13443 RepID=A0ABM4VUC2_COFAR
MFANKLEKQVDDENLPVRLFPESLEGDALDWYSNLKPEEIKTWLNLSTPFMRQYEYNCEFAPTRTTLERTKRKPSEDYKTYSKYWRNLAGKVEPSMTEEEVVRTFIKTHDPPYFEKIFRMIGCSFSAIVNKLEEFDEFIKAGKIVNVSMLKMQLEVLQAAGKIGIMSPKTYPRGVPVGYDFQTICAYHSGSLGHSIVNYWVLKHKIQGMIDVGDIVFRKRDKIESNVSKNSLLEHKSTIRVITIDEEFEEPVEYIMDKNKVIGIVEKPFILEEELLETNGNPFILDLSESVDLTLEGIGHNKALYISIRCNEKLLPRVLIDNKSILNIRPWNTVLKLRLPDARLWPSATIITGFDVARKESMGEVDLVLEIESPQFQVVCQVIDFLRVYNVLFGGPWIHTSNAVPSSLHQKMKFIVNEQLIIMFTEDDCTMIVNFGSNGENGRKCLNSPHHVADIVSVGWIFKERIDALEASVMMVKKMIREEYEIGKRLGWNLQGILEPIEFLGNKDTFGLRFQSTTKDKKEMQAHKK